LHGILHFFGQLHPAITHFPVALLMAGMLAEVFAWWRANTTFHHVAVFNLHVGALGAIAAAALGWCLAATMGIEPDLKATLFWHRWLGTGTAVWAVVSLLFWYRHRAEPTDARLFAYRVSLLAGALLVSITGHIGGLLVYGLDYYSWSLK
jgi:uncharacterized membrane protein